MLCDHLEGWDRECGREAQKGGGYGDICIHIADSLYCTAETSPTLQSNYTPIKMFFKKRKNELGNAGLKCVLKEKKVTTFPNVGRD